MVDVLTRHAVVATDTEVVLQMNQRATELTRKPCIASVVGHTHVYVRWFGAFGCSYTTSNEGIHDHHQSATGV